MWSRITGTVVLCGVVFAGPNANADNLAGLLEKGRSAFRAGNYSDAEFYHRLAASQADSLKPNERAEVLGDLGGVLLALGRYDEARDACLKALDILRNTSPSERYLPVVLNNLGALASQTGNYPQARTYLEEAYRVALKFNSKDPYAARVLNNLGALHQTTGDVGNAEKAFRKGISILEEAGQSSASVPLLTNLAEIYVQQRKWSAASSTLKKALSIPGSSNGHDKATILDVAGRMHQAQGSLSEAREALADAYALRVRSLGRSHPAVAATGSSLADTLTAEKDYPAAETLYREALNIYEAARGPRSFEVATVLEKLARLLRTTKREEEADLVAMRARDLRFELEHVVAASSLR